MEMPELLPPGVHVKNTFLEVEGDSDGSLDLDDAWVRASTEPAKIFKRPSATERSALQSPEGGEIITEPQYVYPQQPIAAPTAATAVATAAFPVPPAHPPPLPPAGRPPQPQEAGEGRGGGPIAQESLRALELDPELAPVFESIKKGRAEAAMRLYQDQELMQKISRKMSELQLVGSQPLAQQPRALEIGPDLSGLVRALCSLEEAFVQEVTISAIRKMPCSVTLADPGLEDCPLIGCSDGFEALTGYLRSEVMGCNCRFLSRGVAMDGATRSALRDAVRLGREFIGVLPNVRKSGERFSNLLRMNTTYVRGKKYIIGVQADVTGLDIDLTKPWHVEELWNLARRIFANNIDAWVQMQAREFWIRQPIPYSVFLKADAPRQFLEAQRQFVVMNLGDDAGRSQLPHLEAVPKGGQDFTMAGGAGGASAATPVSVDRAPAAAAASERSTCTPSVAGGDCSEESADSSRASPAGKLRSVGSAGHPDSCNTECIFYFFRDGCRAGADCRFCHEFHRRKNVKKNRRILRRMSAEAGGAEAAAQPIREDGDGDAGAGGSATPAAAGAAAAAPRRAPGVGAAAAAAPAVPAGERQSVVRYGYGERAPSDGPPQPVTLVAGLRTHLPARMEISAEQSLALEESLTFSVEPALPAGLNWDSRTGLISGTPEAPQEPALYSFTVSVAATGPGGLDLGQVHLAGCQLRIGIVDLGRFALCWGSEEGAAGGGLSLQLWAAT